MQSLFSTQNSAWRPPKNTLPESEKTDAAHGTHSKLWIAIPVTLLLLLVVASLLLFQRMGVFAGSTSHQTEPTPTVAPTEPAGNPTATQTSAPVPQLVTFQQGRDMINEYYTAINAKSYSDAYHLWGSRYHRTTTYAAFARGFVSTLRDVVQIGEVTRMGDGSVKVPITLDATITYGIAVYVNTYQGYYIVGIEDANPKMLEANLHLIATTNDRINQAVATVKQYYADINAKDYQSAYHLWGAAYQRTTTYQQFVAGFAHTQSVSISIDFDNVTVLSEGSVKVPLVVHTSDSTSSGIITPTYQGYYSVGTDGKIWQLYSAELH